MQNIVYNHKSEQEWQRILYRAMPDGFIWNGVGKKGTVITTLIDCIAHMFYMHELEYAKKFNSLALTEDSEFLDDYWDMFQINRFIKEKPTNKKTMFKIVNAFAKARKNLSTAQQIIDFINDVFGLKIDIYIADIRNNIYGNYFPCSFDFNFMEINPDDTAIVIKIPNASEKTSSCLPTEPMPFVLISGEDYSSPIQALLNLVIDINFKLIFI